MSRGSIGLTPDLNDYVVKAQPPEHPVLKKLRQKTAKMPMAEMQIAAEQGHFLAFLVRLIGARTTLEIGTFTGYSALAVALALPKDGKVVARRERGMDRDRPQALGGGGVAKKIQLRLAPALETLAALEAGGMAGRFDFAFIDAHKPEYDGYYEACLKLVRPGGLIAFDNMLQGGNVADRTDRSAGVSAIRALNTKIAKDARVDAVLLPVGDGMTLARRVR